MGPISQGEEHQRICEYVLSPPQSAPWSESVYTALTIGMHSLPPKMPRSLLPLWSAFKVEAQAAIL